MILMFVSNYKAFCLYAYHHHRHHIFSSCNFYSVYFSSSPGPVDTSFCDHDTGGMGCRYPSQFQHGDYGDNDSSVLGTWQIPTRYPLNPGKNKDYDQYQNKTALQDNNNSDTAEHADHVLAHALEVMLLDGTGDYHLSPRHQIHGSLSLLQKLAKTPVATSSS